MHANRNILEEILDAKRAEIKARKKAEPLSTFRGKGWAQEQKPPFAAALRAASMGLIAEVKRRSPSAGAIREPFDPVELSSGYEHAGAQAISVLMDHTYFGGGEDDFNTVRENVEIPLLYKEFVVDAWQIWRASFLGASVVLLIAAAQDQKTLAKLLHTCRDAGVEALVEVHSEEEMRGVAELAPPCVGINNRDLTTFNVSLETSFRIAELAPLETTLISESGIRSAEDVQHLRDAGMHGVLVGEHLLRQNDVGQAIANLMESVWVSS
jgi:indole-3-glycerol phosphate synthase